MPRAPSAGKFATLLLQLVATGPSLAVAAPLVQLEPAFQECSGRAAFVSMAEPADFRDRHDDGAVASRHDRTRNRRVFVQRQVRAELFVVCTIERRQPNQTRFVEHDHVIETLATDGSNEPLDEGILPR